MSVQGASNVCRGCSLSSDTNSPLFRYSSEARIMRPTVVAKLLAECLSVTIRFDDGYPTKICELCRVQLTEYDSFRSSVLRMHRHFTRHLANRDNCDSNAKANTKPIEDKPLPNKAEIVKVSNLKPPKKIEIDPLSLLNDVVEEVVESTNVTCEDLVIAADVENAECSAGFQENAKQIINMVVESLNDSASQETADVDNGYIVDNRFSLPATVKTKNGIQCTFCKRAFRLRKFFELHLCTENGQRLFQCTNCDKVLLYLEVSDHVNRVKCDSVPKSDSLEYLAEMPAEEVPMEYGDVVDNRHLMPKPVKMGKGLSCSFCRRGFWCREFFEFHLCKKGGIPVFQCTHCEKPLTSTKIHEHYKQIPNCAKAKNTIEIGDDDVVDNRRKPQTPIKMSNGLRCNFCKRGFMTRPYFDMHICTKSGQPIFQCTTCEEPLLSYNQIRDHLNKTTKCTKSTSLTIPMISKLIPKKQFQSQICTVCNVRYSTEIGFQYHICSENKIRRYKCNICSWETHRVYGIKLHMIRHTGVRPFACKKCPKKFKLHADLYVHKQIHSTDFRKFICHMCGLAVRSKSHLNAHSVSHMEERPIPCEHCHKSFKTPKMRHRHYVSVHAEQRPHVCELCGATFGLKNRLQRHLRGHREKGELPAEEPMEETLE